MISYNSTLEYLDNVGSHIKDKVKSDAKNTGFLRQNGVLRTNCIDCLDRTNVAQFAAGIQLKLIFIFF